MKITAKTTKQELANVLGANASLVKTTDKGLFDRLSYASKMFKKDETKVTKKDLADLVRATVKALGDKFVEPVLAEEPKAEPKAENSTKVLKSNSSTKKKAVASTPKEESAEKTEPKKEPKKEEKKPVKKSSKKESGVSSVLNSEEEVASKAVLLAEVFRDEFELDGQKYKIARDIANMGQLHDALENDESLVFAMYWTARHLKQFNYSNGAVVAPKEFPMDLDLSTCIYVSDECKVAYAISMYTEACYMFNPDDIEESKGIRFCNGVEFQIYRLVE